MAFWKNLFGPNAEKFEEKGDELRLDLLYRDALFYYRKALDAVEEKSGPDADRLRNKMREVRRKIVADLVEESEELVQERKYDGARDKLNEALDFVDDPVSKVELETKLAEADQLRHEDNPRIDIGEEDLDIVTGTDEDLFELVLAGLDPDDQETARSLGDEFRQGYELCQNEAWDEAVTHFDAVLAEHGDKPLVLELAAMCREHMGEEETARELYARAHRQDPVRAAAVQGYAEALIRMDDADEAFRVVGDAVRAKPAHLGMSEPWVAIHLDFARQLSGREQHNEAVDVIAQLIQAVPGDRGLLYYNLAGILEAAGRDGETRSALESAIEASPRGSIFRERLSDFLVRRGIELDHALQLLVEANQVETTGAAGMFGGASGKATISPNKARYLYKMARVYFLKGEDAEAERTLVTAQHSTKDPEILQAIEELRRDLREAESSS